MEINSKKIAYCIIVLVLFIFIYNNLFSRPIGGRRGYRNQNIYRPPPPPDYFIERNTIRTYEHYNNSIPLDFFKKKYNNPNSFDFLKNKNNDPDLYDLFNNNKYSNPDSFDFLKNKNNDPDLFDFLDDSNKESIRVKQYRKKISNYQNKLKKIGFNDVKVDGSLGPITEAA
ncbi:MAG: hypothetical protein KDK90_28950, partial [Leptospiraceae bacterium]|nr:hypothetical protein [Leptospiraceae bacterium]